jgi:hypothetical protein
MQKQEESTMRPLPPMRLADASALARAAWRWLDDWTIDHLNPPPHLGGKR